MARVKRKQKRKRRQPSLNGGMLEFVSVGLAAAEGRISMDAWARYLAARHPRKH